MSAVSVLRVDAPFKIFVGDGAKHKLMTGVITKGKTSFKEGTAGIEIEWSGGEEIFPNFWEGWGRRVIKGKPNTDETPVEVMDVLYKGEVEFLEYGNPNGYMIHCRWVAGQSSLDYQFQVSRLGLVTKELDEKNLLISLERGEHNINPIADAAYALAIKVHPMNGNSKFKTQRYQNTLYKEVNVYETKNKEVNEIDVDWEAKKIVKDASISFAKLMVLHTILSDGKEIKYDKSDENSLYGALMLYANEEPGEVLRLVQKFKEDISELIEKGKTYNIFDTTKNGEVLVGHTKKEKYFTDLKSKGDNMLQEIFEKIFEPEIFKGIKLIQQNSTKLFK